jgi:hypothetical protein
MGEVCPNCHAPLAVGDWPWCPHGPTRASRQAEWSDADAVVVFKDKNGKFRYPGQNSVVTPKDCERITLRSLRAVEQFEKIANVRSEIAWFDRGSGRGFDDMFRGEDY